MKKGTYKGHILLDEMKDQLKHGCYMSEISQLLGIPYNTIKYHLDSKYRKYILEYGDKRYKDKKNEKRI